MKHPFYKQLHCVSWMSGVLLHFCTHKLTIVFVLYCLDATDLKLSQLI